MKIYKFFRLFNTIKYLKFKQIYFRLFYYVRNRLRRWKGFTYPSSISSHATQLSLQISIQSSNLLSGDEFTFLNLSQRFNDKIDWNFSVFGKLWTYNLNYFEYLNQKELSQEKGLTLIHDFITQVKSVKDGMEPYSISLRGMNWIKFLTLHQIKDQKIDDSLYVQYNVLMDNLEYHLLGNHLLENAFSLLFAAYYFQDEKFYAKTEELLTAELNEQILEDGAHFELSPMYHQIILFRLLECINLVQNNTWKNKELLELLYSKAELMFGWLNAMTFDNGNIPLFNDSANNIAPTTAQLNSYMSSLNSKFKIQNSKLYDSGYRKIKTEYYEINIDVGNIGPDYIPGHAHSDIFNFELHVNNQPLIVDTGLSTYESNDRRQLERSTKSHNTVEIDGENQSEVWGGFRVAKRAKIIDVKESNGVIEATHDGYEQKGILHTRKFVTQEDQIIIHDSLNRKNGHVCMAYFHFYPDVDIHINGNMLICKYLTLSCSSHIELIEYDYSPQFNTKIKARCAIISFQNELETKIKIKKHSESQNENN